MGRVWVQMDFEFPAAHLLPRHPGRCARVHGHNYRLEVTVCGERDASSGMVIDFYDLESAVRAAVLERLDHSNLNDILENPTAENLVVWIWEQLSPRLAGLSELRLWETEQCRVVYRGGA